MNLLGRVCRLLTLMIFTAGLFGCDYASKSAAKAALGDGEAVAVAPDLLRGAVELRYVENTDIAFNAFQRLGVPHPPAMLAGLAAVACLGVLGLAIASRRTSPGKLAYVGLAAVAAGALGNVVDRVLRGYVVDFIHVKGWPVFNVADIAVVVGMGLVFLSQLRKGTDPPSLRPSAPRP